MTWTAFWSLFLSDARRMAPWLALFVAALALDPNLLGRATGQFSWLLGDSEAALAAVVFAVLVVLLVQQENAVRLNAWWLSRPISRAGLLFEKTVFLSVVIGVVVFVYQIAVLQATATPVGPNIGLLLWREFFLLIGFALPCAALGAVSKNLAQAVMIAFLSVAGPVLILSTASESNADLGKLPHWIPDAALLLSCFAASLAAIVAQYWRRSTTLARTLLATGPLVGFGVAGLLPAGAELAIQTATSPHPGAARAIRIRFDGRESARPARGYPNTSGRPSLDLPIRVTGLPPRARLVVNSLKVSMVTADPYRWTSDAENGMVHDIQGEQGWLEFAGPLEAFIFGLGQATPAEVEAELYMTLFAETGRIDPADVGSMRTSLRCKPEYAEPCGPINANTLFITADAGKPAADLNLFRETLPPPFPIEQPGSFTPLGAMLWNPVPPPAIHGKPQEIVLDQPYAYFRVHIPRAVLRFNYNL